MNDYSSLWLLVNVFGFVLADRGYDEACDKIRNYIAVGNEKQKIK